MEAQRRGEDARTPDEFGLDSSCAQGSSSPFEASQSEIELFDDYGLADMVAAITGKEPQAADEFAMYALILIDGLGANAPPTVRRALERSVELAFQFTETFAAALELYRLDRRGMLQGKGSAVELIRHLTETRAARTSPWSPQ